jgi:hypothetical protein
MAASPCLMVISSGSIIGIKPCVYGCFLKGYRHPYLPTAKTMEQILIGRIYESSAPAIQDEFFGQCSEGDVM